MSYVIRGLAISLCIWLLPASAPSQFLQDLLTIYEHIQQQGVLSDQDYAQAIALVDRWDRHEVTVSPDEQEMVQEAVDTVTQLLSALPQDRAQRIDPITGTYAPGLQVLSDVNGVRDLYLRSLSVDNLIVSNTFVAPILNLYVLKTGDSMSGPLSMQSGVGIIFNDDSNALNTTIAAPASLSTTYTLYLPTSSGMLGQVLSQGASGQLVWESVATGTTGIFSINGQTGPLQSLVTGTAGASFNITDTNNIHTFNLPSANTVGTTDGTISYSQVVNYNTAYSAVSAATPNNTPNTLVLRDGSGNFSANTITANLTGTATYATNAGSSITTTTAQYFTGGLNGDVTGSQFATVVSFVGGQSAANVASTTTKVLAATSAPTANTLVLRDGSGSFTTNTLTLMNGLLLDNGATTVYYNSANNQSLTLTGSSVVTTYTLNWPTAIGATNQLLTLGAGGQLGWSTAYTPTSGIYSLNGLTAPVQTFTTNQSTPNFHITSSGSTHTFSLPSANNPATTDGTISNSQVVNYNTAHSAVSTATSNNVANTLVLRDGSGNFSAGTITANLTGTATFATNAQSAVTSTTAQFFTGSLAGDVTGTQSNTVVAFVGGQSAANVASVTTKVLTATSAPTANTLVLRDASGSFTTNTLTLMNELLLNNGSSVVYFNSTNNQSLTLTGSSVVTTYTLNWPTAIGTTNQLLTLGAGGQLGWSTMFTPTSGIYSLNGLTTPVQTFTTNQSTPNFHITSSGSTHTFSLPSANNPATTDGTISNSQVVNYNTAYTAVSTATSNNVANTLVLRDGSGNFSAGTITANLTGTATFATNAQSAVTSTTAQFFTGSLAGDVTGTEFATVVSFVGGQSAANVASATTKVLTATSAPTANTLVLRDASGSFTTNTLTLMNELLLNNGSSVVYFNSTNNQSLTLTGSSVVTTYTLNWPTAIGTTNQLLTLGAGGQLGWSTMFTPTAGIYSLNGLTAPVQTFVTNQSGASFAITSTGSTHTFSLPSANSSGVTDGTISNSQVLVYNSAVSTVTSGTSAAIANTLVLRDTTASAALYTTTLTATANQLTLSSGNNQLILDSGSSAAPRVYTVPDVGTGPAQFVMTAGTQSIGGLKSFTNAVSILNQQPLQLFGSGSNFVGLSAPATVPSSYTVSLPGAAPTATGQVLSALSPTATQWQTVGGALALYVDLSGSDVTGTGSLTAPFASLNKAVSVANTIASSLTPVSIFIGPGVYFENNSTPITITAQGINIRGTSSLTTIFVPVISTNTFLQTGVTSRFEDFTVDALTSATAVVCTGANNASILSRVLTRECLVGFEFSGGSSTEYVITICGTINCGTGLIIDGCYALIYNQSSVGSGAIPTPANTGIIVMGATSLVVIESCAFLYCDTGMYVTDSGRAQLVGGSFIGNATGLLVDNGGQSVANGCAFNQSGLSSIEVTDGGQLQATACNINGLNPTPMGIGLLATNSAQVAVSDTSFIGLEYGLITGTTGDTPATAVLVVGATLVDCTIAQIQQNGMAALSFVGGSYDATMVNIANPGGVTFAAFDSSQNNSLTIGNYAETIQDILHIENGEAVLPDLKYYPAYYGHKGIVWNCPNPGQSTVLGVQCVSGDALVSAVTQNEAQTARVRLYADTTGVFTGTGPVRGWDIIKTATLAPLAFQFINTVTADAPAIDTYTPLSIDGFANTVNFPLVTTTNQPTNATAQLNWAGDTNLYRVLAGVLKTDNNLRIGGLTSGNVALIADGNKQVAASVTTSTELGYVSGVTGPIQAQINGKVSKSGDTMTGTLVLPAGTAALPSLAIGTITTGLSAATPETLVLSTNGINQFNISPQGNVTITAPTNGTGLTVQGGGAIITGTVSVSGGIITTPAITISNAPVNPTDGTNKAYVDSVAQGIAVKNPSVVVAVGTNETLSGLPTIDGVTLTNGQQVCLTSQTNPVENGLWLVSAGAWSRPTDFANGSVAQNAYTFIQEGTVYANSSFICTTPDAIVGTDPLTFVQFSSAENIQGVNLGSGAQIFAQKLGSDLQFRTLTSDSNLLLTQNTDTVNIAFNTSISVPGSITSSGSTVQGVTITDGTASMSAGNISGVGLLTTNTIRLANGTASLPALQFTASPNTGLYSPSANALALSANGVAALSIASTGTVTINDLSTGVVHAGNTGALTSSLIVDADIALNTITDDRLQTISTPGKVANSATTATSLNQPNTIVMRDGSGNFAAGTITDNLLAGNGTVSAPSISFTNSQQAGLYLPAVNKVSLATAGADRLVVDPAGFVTIPTLSPTGFVFASSSGTLSTAQVTGSFIAAGTITGSNIAAGTITGSNIASNTIAYTQLTPNPTSAPTPNTLVLRDATGSSTSNTLTLMNELLLNNGSSVVYYNSANNQSLTLTGSSVVTTYTLNWPTAIGATNQLLTLGAGGQLGWSTMFTPTSGIYSLNGLTTPVQTFTTNQSTPNFHITSAGSTHTFSLPSANNPSTTDGTISNSQVVSYNTAYSAVSTATSNNVANTLVLRDGSGNFSAGTITANLTGTATFATNAQSAVTSTTAQFFTGNLAGDVTGTEFATVVSFVGGQSAANVASATTKVLAATSAPTANTLVLRDATGSFTTNTLTLMNGLLLDNGATTVYFNSANNQSLTLTGSSVVTTYTLNWPTAIGATNQLLTLGAGGQLGWSTMFTPTSGIYSLNGLTTPVQTFTTNQSTPNFHITSAGSTHTFSLPSANNPSTTDGTISNSQVVAYNSAVTTLANATSAPTANALVLRDATGSFTTNTLTLMNGLLLDNGATTVYYNSANNQSLTLTGSSVVTTYTLNWPTAIGATNQLLTLGAGGQLGWSTMYTPTAGIYSLNGLTTPVQTFTTNQSTPNFHITSAGSTHTFSLPSANNPSTTDGTISNTQVVAYNSAVSTVNSATSAPTANTLVLRDATGSFTTNTLTLMNSLLLDKGGTEVLFNTANTQSITLTGSSVVTTYTLNWPTAIGATNQLLTLGAGGQLGWSTMYTPTAGIYSLNTLTGPIQTFTTNQSGASFSITSAGTTHTFSLPSANTSGTTDGTISNTQVIIYNSAVSTLNSATSASVANTLVLRDSTSSFSARNISALGNLQLPSTTTTTGQLQINNTRVLQAFGTNNIFVGAGAGNVTLSGSLNSGFGASALSGLTSGTGNIGIGYQSNMVTTTGSSNIAIGAGALTTNVTAVGNGNIVLGDHAGQLAASGAIGNSNIYIGNNMQGVAGESNTCRIDNIYTTTLTSTTWGLAAVDNTNLMGTVFPGTNGYRLASFGSPATIQWAMPLVPSMERMIFDDFLYNANVTGAMGDTNWVRSISGGSMSNVVTTTTMMGDGWIQLTSGTAGTSFAAISKAPTTMNFWNTSQTYYQEWRVFISTLSNGTNGYVIRIGWGDTLSSSAVDFNNGAYFEYNQASGNLWVLKQATGGSPIAFSSGVTIVANTVYTLGMLVTGGFAYYYINGAPVGPHPVSTPTAANFTPTAIIARSLGSGGSFAIDYFFQYITT